MRAEKPWLVVHDTQGLLRLNDKKEAECSSGRECRGQGMTDD